MGAQVCRGLRSGRKTSPDPICPDPALSPDPASFLGDRPSQPDSASPAHTIPVPHPLLPSASGTCRWGCAPRPPPGLLRPVTTWPSVCLSASRFGVVFSVPLLLPCSYASARIPPMSFQLVFARSDRQPVLVHCPAGAVPVPLQRRLRPSRGPYSAPGVGLTSEPLTTAAPLKGTPGSDWPGSGHGLQKQ